MLTLLFLILPLANAHKYNFCGPQTKRGEICMAPVAALRPTQFSKGEFYVHFKRLEFSTLREAGTLRKYVQGHPVDGVIGPGGVLFIKDGTHFACALEGSEIDVVPFEVVRNWSHLGWDEFWTRMIDKKWFYPFRLGQGPMRPEDLPEHVSGLANDSYRSLASLVRKAGGYEKTLKSFSEFIWADFLRTRIVLADDESNLLSVVPEAVELARSEAARDLPGWLGPRSCEHDLIKP